MRRWMISDVFEDGTAMSESNESLTVPVALSCSREEDMVEVENEMMKGDKLE